MTAAFGLLIAGGVMVVAGVVNRSVIEVLQGIVTPVGDRKVGSVASGSASLPGDSLSGTPAQNRALGKRMAAQAGITGSEWACMDELVMRESGWDANADNPTSTAAGIPQDISGNLHGGARGQIAWMITYVRSRYGTFCKAIEFHDAHNWY